MNGMTSSDFHLLLLLACGALLPLQLRADEVALSDGSLLSGNVISLSEDGRLLLESELALDPLELRADQVSRVNFAPQKHDPDQHDSLLVLSNGDQFPADLVSIDADRLHVTTSFAGPLEIPRSFVHTAQLGVRPRKVIYRGPTELAGWQVKSGWRFEENRFISEAGGTLARSFALPESYALRFKVTWRNLPNLQVHFGGDSLEIPGKADRYHLTFNSSGIDVRREQSKDGARELPMINIPRDPSSFPDATADIELRVDRKIPRIHIYLNGEFQGRYADPLDTSPGGGGVIFRSNLSGGDDSLSLSAIEVREWDASADRHRSEERGDPTKDAIILRDGDRGVAKIIGLAPGPDGGTLTYQFPHRAEPVETKASDISTLFFTRSAADAPPTAPLRLVLRSRGTLGVSSCTFKGDAVEVKHPVLGNLKLDRRWIDRLERTAATEHSTANDESDETPEEEEEE